MSNHFNVLPESDDDDEEIRDMKHLRNTKKKLGKKEQKMKGSPSPELLGEINKIRILIREYEDKDKTPTGHKKKKEKKGAKEKKNDDFNDDEINKFNKQRGREMREENERKKEEKRKRDAESAKYWKNYKEKFQKEEEDHYYYRRDQSEPDPEMTVENNITIRGLLKSLELVKKELPDDIREIIDHFDKSKWKKLCMKYHPDKCKEGEDYGILLNGIKDHYEPKEIKYDETWTKEP